MSQHIETMFVVGIGGFIGANVRYLVATWVAEKAGQSFPWATLLINVSGSILLAVFLSWFMNHQPDSRWRMLIAVGFFGAYTTFSTYSVETILLLQAGNFTGAAANFLITNLLCIVGALIGWGIGSRF